MVATSVDRSGRALVYDYRELGSAICFWHIYLYGDEWLGVADRAHFPSQQSSLRIAPLPCSVEADELLISFAISARLSTYPPIKDGNFRDCPYLSLDECLHLGQVVIDYSIVAPEIDHSGFVSTPTEAMSVETER